MNTDGTDLATAAAHAAHAAGLALTRDVKGLALTDGHMEVRGDFSHMASRIKPANLNRELIVKAVRIKGTRPEDAPVVDATAGLGEDSLLLAAAGFSVALYERNPAMAALLQDAIDRAAADPALAEPASRMRLEYGDSIELLPRLSPQPAIVLLDPMFPERHKSSAVKKKLQLLQRLERPCEDDQSLFDAAISAHPKKIVVKRPAKGPRLTDRKPDYSIEGKAVRFDCYMLASQPKSNCTM